MSPQSVINPQTAVVLVVRSAHYIPTMQLVECEVMRLGLDRSNNSYVVILREKEGERLLPIWIGQAEAESIVIEMSKLKRERPLTHDLCKTLITGMGGTLRRIQITKVENRTYYAELHIRLNEKMIQVDARPSDSIAIALRFSAPIFAQEDLLTSLLFDDSSDESEAIPSTPEPEQSDQMTADQLQKYLENLRPEDLGKFNI